MLSFQSRHRASNLPPATQTKINTMKLHITHRLTAFILFSLLPSTLLRAAPPFVGVALTSNGTPIQGSVTLPPSTGLIEGLGFDHEIIVERDPTSGQATGRRQHKPIRIVKPIDKATPLLYKAMTENRDIAGEFRFWRAVVTGGMSDAGYARAMGLNSQIDQQHQTMLNGYWDSMGKYQGA